MKRVLSIMLLVLTLSFSIGMVALASSGQAELQNTNRTQPYDPEDWSGAGG